MNSQFFHVSRAVLSLSTVALLTFAFVSGCGPSARVRSPDEASLVGTKRAGAVVYRNVIDQALADLSQKYRATNKNVETFNKLRISFVGVDNKTNEELGSWRHQINGIIDNRINVSGDFVDISYERFVKPALDELGIARSSFVLPKNRRAFARLMEQQGNPVDGILFANMTQGDTRAGGLKQSDYVLFFELMSVKDGTRITAHGEISIERS